MSEIAHIAATIFRRSRHDKRMLVAIAGAPASGKSTLALELAATLTSGGQSAIVVSMDGFHYDDAVLEKRGLRGRKGAPETFDFAGFECLLKRLVSEEGDVAIPVFDRSMELARAAADIVAGDHRIVLVEGNYLLLDEAPWSGLRPLFDFTIFLEVPRGELERRLLQRWRDHGRADGPAWVASNDMPNVDRVIGKRLEPDLLVRSEPKEGA